ncbi:MAG: glutathione S-transferase family protein [gamma proteobacterium symbiont of Bathyaustriella thionipta]|nr:glutathione S-transferase family protein [gamma proteobacterium symbiont of Bathyaustriella thionipta]MCU7950625.1 glutathione S-transferase family protein [gamma proteobacterium symbiont of Bathyaustriella thionipta]MCU7954761.1 glutathione S-transferase family protein [gamma proteobacterium symbiont of Bathyaustriella thionipta]MCU7957120.1 glutathione S-transferase family protein [gamma proteobacterium symbiont of Bathyaustriella thionipta]MCU7967919.1 glutathione S-transferase family pro
MNVKLNIVKGEFIRTQSSFRNWITKDGRAGPGGNGGFTAEPDRYHLYVSYACPWAHRTLIFRALKGLEEVISISVVHPLMPEESWVFGDYPGATEDHINHADALYENYLLADPEFTGLVTVPVLWDKIRQTIVNNESSEIIRMLNSAFVDFAKSAVDYYPDELRKEIDEINELVYININNGVYRAGFATSQDAYENAYDHLFNSLDALEDRLSKQRYLVGDQITEADWRLFTTLVRFDAVYYSHFKTNKKRLTDYPNLWSYTCELYQVPGVAETVNMDHIKYHYFASHRSINPTGIVPKGPELDFGQPHGREYLG